MTIHASKKNFDKEIRLRRAQALEDQKKAADLRRNKRKREECEPAASWRPARQPKTGKRPGSDARRRSATARRRVAARQGKGGRPSSPLLGRTRPRPGSRPGKGILNTASITRREWTTLSLWIHGSSANFSGRPCNNWSFDAHCPLCPSSGICRGHAAHLERAETSAEQDSYIPPHPKQYQALDCCS